MNSGEICIHKKEVLKVEYATLVVPYCMGQPYNVVAILFIVTKRLVFKAFQKKEEKRASRASLSVIKTSLLHVVILLFLCIAIWLMTHILFTYCH